MSTKYFNFNHEKDLTAVEQNDETQEVTFTIGDQSRTFASLQEFAEFYAMARNVRNEDLKNWELQEDGDQFAFILRAGTAGSDISDMVEQLKLAGSTPEEIGRAVAAYSNGQVNQEVHSEQLDLFESAEPTTELGREVQEFLNEYDQDGIQMAILKLVYAGYRGDTLADQIALDADLEDYLNSGEVDEYGDYDVPSIYDFLADVIQEFKETKREEFNGLPIEAIVAILGNEDSDDIDESFKSARFAASMAGRQVEVAIKGENGVYYAMSDSDNARAAFADATKRYYRGGRFVFVL